MLKGNPKCVLLKPAERRRETFRNPDDIHNLSRDKPSETTAAGPAALRIARYLNPTHKLPAARPSLPEKPALGLA